LPRHFAEGTSYLKKTPSFFPPKHLAVIIWISSFSCFSTSDYTVTVHGKVCSCSTITTPVFFCHSNTCLVKTLILSPSPICSLPAAKHCTTNCAQSRNTPLHQTTRRSVN
jgi:hypothetical protein